MPEGKTGFIDGHSGCRAAGPNRAILCGTGKRETKWLGRLLRTQVNGPGSQLRSQGWVRCASLVLQKYGRCRRLILLTILLGTKPPVGVGFHNGMNGSIGTLCWEVGKSAGINLFHPSLNSLSPLMEDACGPRENIPETKKYQKHRDRYRGAQRQVIQD